jgi:large subunit ribosomal protein L28
MFATLSTWAAAVVSAPLKRAQTGLYHGVTKQSGNNVPFSKGKTRRTWLPNVHNKTYYSEALQKNVRVKVSMKALKTIKKVCTLLVHFREPG